MLEYCQCAEEAGGGDRAGVENWWPKRSEGYTGGDEHGGNEEEEECCTGGGGSLEVTIAIL